MNNFTKLAVIGGLLAAMSMLPSRAFAGSVTSSGTLTVSGTIQSSISMVFDSDGSGVALTGSGSNAATLGFGNVSAYYSLASNVSRSVNGSSDYTVSTPFDVKVTQANGSSLNYSLTAQLGTADSTNSWTIDTVAVTNASAASITTTGSYGSDQSHTLNLKIPFSEAAGAISNTVNFVATAN